MLQDNSYLEREKGFDLVKNINQFIGFMNDAKAFKFDMRFVSIILQIVMKDANNVFNLFVSIGVNE
jgi:hypothetical protein